MSDLQQDGTSQVNQQQDGGGSINIPPAPPLPQQGNLDAVNPTVSSSSLSSDQALQRSSSGSNEKVESKGTENASQDLLLGELQKKIVGRRKKIEGLDLESEMEADDATTKQVDMKSLVSSLSQHLRSGSERNKNNKDNTVVDVASKQNQREATGKVLETASEPAKGANNNVGVDTSPINKSAVKSVLEQHLLKKQKDLLGTKADNAKGSKIDISKSRITEEEEFVTASSSLSSDSESESRSNIKDNKDQQKIDVNTSSQESIDSSVDSSGTQSSVESSRHESDFEPRTQQSQLFQKGSSIQTKFDVDSNDLRQYAIIQQGSVQKSKKQGISDQQINSEDNVPYVPKKSFTKEELESHIASSVVSAGPEEEEIYYRKRFSKSSAQQVLETIYEEIPYKAENKEEATYEEVFNPEEAIYEEVFNPEEAIYEEIPYKEAAIYENVNAIKSAGQSFSEGGIQRYINASYVLGNGVNVIDEENDADWLGVRTAIMNGQPVDQKLLVNSPVILSARDFIIKKQGHLNKSEVENLVKLLEENKGEICKIVNKPLAVDMPTPSGDYKGIMTLLHLAYAYNVDLKVINCLENIQLSGQLTQQGIYHTPDAYGNLPLHFAALSCDDNKMKHCITKTGKSTVNTLNFHNQSPLHLMGYNQNCSVQSVKMMMRNNGYFDIHDINGKLPLHYFAEFSKAAVLTHVIDHMCKNNATKPLVNALDASGYSLMSYIVKNPHVSHHNIKNMRAKGVDLECSSIDGKNAISHAICADNIKLVNALLRYCDVNKSDNELKTALHHAVLGNNKDIVKSLCEFRLRGKQQTKDFVCKKSLLSRDLYGNTPLHLACQQDNNTLPILLSAMKKCYNKDDLTLALSGNNIEISKQLNLGFSKFNDHDIIQGSNPDFIRYTHSLNLLNLSPLHYAIKTSNVSALRKITNILPQGVLNHPPDGKLNCYHIAAMYASAKVMKFMLNSTLGDAAINTPTESGLTPLHMACIRGNHEIVDAIVSSPALEINQCMGKNNNTVLHYAVSNRCYSNIANILKRHVSADVNIKNSEGNTPLHLAVEQMDMKSLKMLCSKKGVDVNAVNYNGQSIMFSALVPGQSEDKILNLVSMLLKKGVDLNLPENQDRLLLQCVKCGYNKVLDKLISSGARIGHDQNVMSPLIASVIYNNVDAFKKLCTVANNFNGIVKEKNSVYHGKNILEIAVVNSNFSMLKAIMSSNFDVTVPISEGVPLCDILLQHGDYDFARRALKLILSRDSATNKRVLSVQDGDGDTSIHLAIKTYASEMANVMAKSLNNDDLFEVGSIPNNDGNTVLHLAIQANNFRVVESMMKNCTSNNMLKLLSIKNNEGDTPLHDAIKGNKLELVKFALKGLDRQNLNKLALLQDKNGNTMLHLVLTKASEFNLVPQGKTCNDIIQLITKSLDKTSMTELVNTRNNEGNTPTHSALLLNSLHAKQFIKHANKDTLLFPNASGSVLSECISDNSIFNKRTMFGLMPSLKSQICKLEKQAKSTSYTFNESLLSIKIDDKKSSSQEEKKSDLLVRSNSVSSLLSVSSGNFVGSDDSGIEPDYSTDSSKIESVVSTQSQIRQKGQTFQKELLEIVDGMSTEITLSNDGLSNNTAQTSSMKKSACQIK